MQVWIFGHLCITVVKLAYIKKKKKKFYVIRKANSVTIVLQLNDKQKTFFFFFATKHESKWGKTVTGEFSHSNVRWAAAT